MTNRSDLSWASASSGPFTLTAVMIGGEVYVPDDDGGLERVGSGWQVRIGPDGGALEVGE